MPSPPVVLEASRTMQGVHIVCLSLFIYTKSTPLKGSVAEGSASHSLSRAFVQSLPQLKL